MSRALGEARAWQEITTVRKARWVGLRAFDALASCRVACVLRSSKNYPRCALWSCCYMQIVEEPMFFEMEKRRASRKKEQLPSFSLAHGCANALSQ